MPTSSLAAGRPCRRSPTQLILSPLPPPRPTPSFRYAFGASSSDVLKNVFHTFGYRFGSDIKMVISSHPTSVAKEVKREMGAGASEHGVLFVSMGQVQGMIIVRGGCGGQA